MGRSKNLLKNARAKRGLAHWVVLSSKGDGFACEGKPVGSKPICDCTHIKANLSCWATSYESCVKMQLVNLLECGISEESLDNNKPRIIARDWYCPRFDCGCEYKLSVRLLGDDKETELDKWEFNDKKEAGADWTKVKHVFKNYPTGVRYVEFTHGGQDTKYWAGHFGVKMTNSGVFVGKKKRKPEQKKPLRIGNGKNLVKNPCAKFGMDDWEVTANGGNGFKAEETPGGCKSIKEVNPHATEASGWATSHGACEKKQLIDLRSSDIPFDVIDSKKPEIKISEWYGARSDAGIEYWLTVRLLDGDMQELDKKEFKESKSACGDWFQVIDSFKDYPTGARYVEFIHGGKDSCFWAGHFGAKITCSSLIVEPIEMVPVRNLVQNPCGKSGMDHWEVTANGGNGFLVEETPGGGCKPIKEANPTAKEDCCWATSHGPCEKKQLIDLQHSGISVNSIDNQKPEIKISEWYGARSDAGIEYWLRVRLLDGDMQELDKKEFKDSKDACGDWFQVTESFKCYPKGVRYIEYIHGGKDNCFWAGYYGAKITCSSVTIEPVQPKKGGNLVKNPCGKCGVEDWEVTANGGDGFLTETSPGGSYPIKEAKPNAEGDSNWATSYGPCEKKQLVDLSSSGINVDVIDNQKPDIKISEWYGARRDAGIEYWLKIRLLDGSLHELERKEFKDFKGASGEWFKVTESFTDYPKGARFVEYTHGGKDNCNWAGHYGAKITCSSVTIEDEEDGNSSSSSSDEE